MKTSSKRFGFDLDNTLIDYSKSVTEYCRIKKLNPCSNIRMLQENLRAFDDSDYSWQLAQGWLYSDGLAFAEIGVGFIELCEYLTLNDYQLYIVSHKTSHTPSFCGSKPLREIASAWIEESLFAKFFKEPNQIYFEPTRKKKISRIKKLSLSYFVDDLDEIFLEKKFPSDVKKFLIYSNRSNNPKVICVPNFKIIKRIICDEY